MPYPRAGNSLRIDRNVETGLVALGVIVRERRRMRSLTQSALEGLVGVDQTVLSRLENGRLYHLTLPRLAAIFAVLESGEPPESEAVAVERGLEVIAELVYDARRRFGLVQRSLERLSGVDQTVISRLENAKHRHLRLTRIAAIFGVLYEEVADRSTYRPRSRRPIHPPKAPEGTPRRPLPEAVVRRLRLPKRRLGAPA